jgi:hypothetical protein
MEKIKRTITQVVEAENLDHQIEENVKFGHTILAVVPVRSCVSFQIGGIPVQDEIVNYKIIMLDCRFNG